MILIYCYMLIGFVLMALEIYLEREKKKQAMNELKNAISAFPEHFIPIVCASAAILYLFYFSKEMRDT